jgi:Icc-related predicted phosphoesterase
MSTYIMGDTHGYFSYLNKFINRHNPDYIIQCGDFGYYPDLIETQGAYGETFRRFDDKNDFDLSQIKNHDTKIYWIPGNHEVWNNIEKYYKRNHISPMEMKDSNIFYCPIGSSEIIDGKQYLFIGGASSYDKQLRTEGFDWFPEEDLTRDDFNFIMDNNHDKKIDVIISHTCPVEFNVGIYEPDDKINDYNRRILSEFLHHFKPDYWFCGHWHKYKKGMYKNTEWTILDCNTGEDRYFEKFS